MSGHLSGFQHAHFDVQVRSGYHINERVKREQVDFPAQQIGHAGLCHGEPASRFSLGPTLGTDMLFKRHHKSRA